MSRLADFITKLSSSQHLRFRSYLDSPYFTPDKRLLQLYDLLKNQPPEVWDKRQLFEAIFPEEDFHPDRINNFFSYLTRAAENFLGQEAWEQHPFYPAYFKLQGARQMGLNRSFGYQLRRLDSTATSSDDYFRQYLISDESDMFFMQKASREKDQSLGQKLSALHLFYLTAMLRSACEWLSRKNVIGNDEQPAELIASIPFLLSQAAYYETIPQVHIYHHILLTLTEPENESHFATLKAALASHALPPEVQKPMYQFAQNYCIFQVNRGNSAYLVSLFDLYDEMSQRNLLFHEGYISPGDVKNIVALGARLGKYEWANRFLLSVTDKISPAYRDAVLSYNKAYLHYSASRLRDALRILASLDYPDLYYDLGARTLLLRIYYEMEDYEGLESQIQAFEAYLRRQKTLSLYQREAYRNLLYFTRKLSRIRAEVAFQAPSVSKKRFTAFLRKLHTVTSVMARDWLIAQTEIIKQGR
ncbi:MAG: hypothetical protein R3C61_03900 [Bacteroidia bacterium]